MTNRDFEGDYGRHYAETIRISIPAYDAIQEIGAAALAAVAPDDASVLVVGPGLGDELPGLFAAIPRGRFTLLEPSAQMGRGCAARIAAEGAATRCLLLQRSLGDAGTLEGEPFAAVVCHHVLHLMPPNQQRLTLQQLAARVAPGGALLVSSYSEPSDPATRQALQAIGLSRLRELGVGEEILAAMMAGLNRDLFSLDESLLAEELAAAGMEPPLQLMQAMCIRLWLCRRPSERVLPIPGRPVV